MSLPYCVHEEGKEALRCCPGSPGFGQVLDSVFSRWLHINPMCWEEVLAC